MQATDHRIALSSELFGAMKHIKLMAHEAPYTARLLQARQRELAMLRKNHLATIWLNALAVGGAGFALVAMLFWHTKVEGHELSASTAFTSVIITETLRASTQVGLEARPQS